MLCFPLLLSGSILVTGHYTIDYADTNWEPRKILLFTKTLPYQPKVSIVDQFQAAYPAESAFSPPSSFARIFEL